MTNEHNSDAIIALAAAVREQANAYITSALAKQGVTDLLPAHGAVLRALFQQNPLQMGLLAEEIGRKKNTVTSLINTLEERGYCKRVPDPQDARVQLVALTDKGETMREKQAQVSANMLRKLWQGVSEQEKNNCVHTLRKIVENLAENQSE